MPTATTPATASAPQQRKSKTPKQRQQNPVAAKVNPMLIAAAIALIIVGALAGWFVLNTQSATTAVLTVTQAVPRGAEISQEHLGTIEVSEASAASYLTAQDPTQVVGKTALADLAPGTPLTADNIGQLTTSGAEAIVGVPLTTAQMPSTTITAGDSVSVVSTAGNNAESGSTPLSIDATVFSVRNDTTTGLTIVDLTIAPDDARLVASLAASGDVALVLLETGERA